MCGAIANWPRLLTRSITHLRPGGWLELQDYFVLLQSIDGTLEGTALERWNRLLFEGAGKMGIDGRAAARFAGYLREAGFVDVMERKFALPANTWAQGHEAKLLGEMQMTNIIQGLRGISTRLFPKVHGMTMEEVEELLVDTERDLRDTGIHAYYVV